MRKLLFIFVLIAAASGCTHLTAPTLAPSSTAPGDMTSYFWPDATSTYIYQSTTDKHTVTVMKGGAITDQNISGFLTPLTASQQNGNYLLSGFSANDLFGLDSFIKIVNDTSVVAPRTETIRSIAAISNPPNSTILYAVSDSVLYTVDLTSNTLVRNAPLPVQLQARGLSLAEDVEGKQLYAFDSSSGTVGWTKDGVSWTTYPTYPGITAFTSADPNDGHQGDLCWFACGANLYRLTNSSGTSIRIPVNLGGAKIVALEWVNGGAIAGTDDGKVYDIDRSGSSSPPYIASGTIQGLASLWVSTSMGIYNWAFLVPVVATGNYSSIYSGGGNVFAAKSDGSIYSFAIPTFPATPPSGSSMPGPVPGTAVIQFAYPDQGPPYDPTKGLYVLVGTQIYLESASVWIPVKQAINTHAPPALGGLVLLANDSSSWLAGYAESNTSGSPKAYYYEASFQYHADNVLLNSINFQDVIAVKYVAYSNGTPDISDMPQYVISYQRGTGPIQFRKIENGDTTVTTISK